MQYLISGLLFILSSTSTLGQVQVRATEVQIIGTIHHGNRHFNHKTLYNTIKSYKPDVILWEHSENFKRVVGLKTAYFLKIAKPGIEQLSLQKYSKLNKDIKILPYDTSFVSRRQYIEQHSKIHQAFFDNLNSVTMVFADSMRYADYADKRNQYYDFIANADLIRINKPDVIDKSRDLYAFEQNHLIAIAKKYVTDSLVVKQFEENLKFRVARNSYMTDQIQMYLRQFAGQRIIILAGLNHKYCLQDKLLTLPEMSINFIELETD